ncbi:cofactor-independent phosphoglycerate mutase [Methanocalculus taiwanensis]|uniref:phosphoglycerate mutase (2,3-diphosphoglycerate-independent) n=2 Tax=Methanocalculus taiwanensis TaxID=106207 RepID=A0ABD4TPZ2_9EURY|nr:cofactor-independent phosphoglycerate mutase [Methanocalculus taiwanensis]
MKRKCLLILGDGMADEPIEALGKMSPLEYASTPNMDTIARNGRMGLLETVPPGFEPGSDVANLSVLGYDPALYYTGRGPLEAASMGVDLAEDDIAYRCNLVTIRDGVMEDFSAGHISSEEGMELFSSLQEALTDVSLYPGISYRNLLVLHHGKGSSSTPPHDIVGQPIRSYLPKGADADILCHCMEVSAEVFADHPVNLKRIEKGQFPATSIWPWSGGQTPKIPSFEEQYGRSGGMISAVDLLFGIARIAGMEVIKVPGATGYLDTNYEGKIRYALDALKWLDFVYVHVEAPDEAGHLGSLEEKVRAIERLDEVLGIALAEFDGIIAVLPDHPTPLRIKTHTSDPVPFAVLGKGHDDCGSYSEREAEKGSYGLIRGPELLPLLFTE